MINPRPSSPLKFIGFSTHGRHFIGTLGVPIDVFNK